MIRQAKAVIFDLDGVIVDSNPAIEAFWKSWTDRESIPLTEALTREWIHGRKAVDTVGGLFGHLTTARQQQIIEDAFVFDQTMQPPGVAGIVPFILDLNLLGIATGVVTSSHHSRMLQFLEALGIADSFTGFVTAHDVTQGKPHPEPYLKMSAQLGIDPASCLVFEDAVSGLRSAAAAGMQVIAVGAESSRSLLMQEGASALIPDFNVLKTLPSGIYLDDRLVFSF
ncbi:MAG: HAD family phosphatase [Chitinophagaceae bacterium]|nr:HAD family phosphatase [Chitinophagaceae bacterium]